MPFAHTLLPQVGMWAHVQVRTAPLQVLQHLLTQEKDWDPESPGLKRRADAKAESVPQTTSATTGNREATCQIKPQEEAGALIKIYLRACLTSYKVSKSSLD